MPKVLADGLISLDIELILVHRHVGLLQYRQHLDTRLRRASRSHLDRPEERPELRVAGLLQSQNDMIQQRVPGVGKMPVLGPLFSSKAYQRRETDLVIIVTPYLVKPIDPSKKVATPFDATVSANNAEFQAPGRRSRSPPPTAHWLSPAASSPRRKPASDTSSICRRNDQVLN